MAVSLNPFEQRLVNFPNFKLHLLFKRFVLEKRKRAYTLLEIEDFLVSKEPC